MVSAFHYATGGDVQPGDHVRYHGEFGSVEFVASDRIGDAAQDWYFDEYGGGVMIAAENFGRVFLISNDIDESLEFVERGFQDGAH